MINLYNKVIHPLNIWEAYQRAAKGKRYKPAAAFFEYDLEENLITLERDLQEETYSPGEYQIFEIQKPKRRLIHAAPFRDRVVHHALMNVIEPVFERQFIFDSYANRKGKGTHAALDRCTYFLRRNTHVMHLDVRQFFPSIDHEILLFMLMRRIGDERVMRLVRKILASGRDSQAGECDPVYFPGDTLFSVIRPRGLPIGNLTSQHWGNVYLNDLDQYVKRVMKCRAYIRYVDDLLLFSDHKTLLQEWRAAIIEFLCSLRLTIHEAKAQPRPSTTGVPFLGFQVFPDHRRLKPANGYGFQRRLRRMLQNDSMNQEALRAGLVSWLNHAKYGDTWALRCSILSNAGIFGGGNG